MSIDYLNKTLKVIAATLRIPRVDGEAAGMHATKIEDRMYLVDVEAAGIENFVASYVLMGDKVAIVETGPTSSVPNLLSALKELNVKTDKVAYVAVSHIHLDHGGGAGTLLKHLPNAKVVVHQRGAPHLANPETLWQQSREVLGKITEMYGPPEPVPEERIIAATDGLVLDLGKGIKLEVIETLGHASHHQSYFERQSGTVFPGDAAGIYLNKFDVIVPTTPPPFRMDIALAALDKLASLRPKTLCYTHFGKADKPLERLQSYARQLRLWAETAKESLEKKLSLQATTELISERDEAMHKAWEYLRTHPVMSDTVIKESLQGVMGFVEKYGLPQS